MCGQHLPLSRKQLWPHLAFTVLTCCFFQCLLHFKCRPGLSPLTHLPLVVCLHLSEPGCQCPKTDMSQPHHTPTGTEPDLNNFDISHSPMPKWLLADWLTHCWAGWVNWPSWLLCVSPCSCHFLDSHAVLLQPDSSFDWWVLMDFLSIWRLE